MRFCPNVIHRHMVVTLGDKEQLKRCFNLVFSGLRYSKTTTSFFKVMIDVKELETSQGGMKCP